MKFGASGSSSTAISTTRPKSARPPRGEPTREKGLRAEVLKAPHHGSADFSAAFIKAVEPVRQRHLVRVTRESRKEYIHPRATLVGALARSSRLVEPADLRHRAGRVLPAGGLGDPAGRRGARRRASSSPSAARPSGWCGCAPTASGCSSTPTAARTTSRRPTPGPSPPRARRSRTRSARPEARGAQHGLHRRLALHDLERTARNLLQLIEVVVVPADSEQPWKNQFEPLSALIRP